MKLFQKKKENFICQNCKTENLGDGFTNHCSNCLYSKHVDINPGDRSNECLGLMKPIDIEKKGSQIKIVHECINCKLIKKNKINESDNFDEIVRISSLDKDK